MHRVILCHLYSLSYPLPFFVSATPPVTTFELAHTVVLSCFVSQENNSLTRINLGNNRIGDEGAKHLGSGLAVRICVIARFQVVL